MRLSIPSWSDFNLALLTHGSMLSALSIPSWSDFNALIRIGERLSKVFQSHLGLILTDRGVGEGGFADDFQSHLGLILTTFISTKLSLVYLSIPSWSDFNRAGEGSARISPCFQSHLGLILTGVSIEEIWRDYAFNPILV